MTLLDPIRWVYQFATLVRENADHLTELDAAIGDADHGGNIRRGATAVTEALARTPPSTTPVDTLQQVGMVLIRTVGGASGPLYGTFFLRFAATVGPGRLDAATFATAFRAGVNGIVTRGRAEAGDKTMYDALGPAADAFDRHHAAGAGFTPSMDAALAAAETGRDATIRMQARKGRASYLGERSVGHQDPGATSAALLVRAARQALR